MKRVRFRDPAGSVRIGEWNDGRIVFADREFDADRVAILPPSDPSKVIGIANNHESAFESPDDYPDEPQVFVKPPNTLSGHGDTVTLAVDEEEIIFEGEMGAIIGEQCRNVSADDALDVVAGFTPLNDISRIEQNSMTRVKVFDNALPIGPTITPPKDVPADATIETRINGKTKQRDDRSGLLFSLPEIIADLTRGITLEPGDVIAMGTPAGAEPLRDGDSVEVEVEGVGTLRHHVETP